MTGDDTGWAILASFFRHILSIQCVAPKSCIDCLTSGEEVHQQDSFGILYDSAFNFAHRVGRFKILCWRGIIFVSSMTCAPVFITSDSWFSNATLVSLYWSRCYKHKFFCICLRCSCTCFGSQCAVIFLWWGVSWTISCSFGEILSFATMLRIFMSVHTSNAFHMTCHFDVSVVGLTVLAHHVSSAILECFAPHGNLVPVHCDRTSSL
jgi:hypothetical protein